MPAKGEPILSSEGKLGDPTQPIVEETAPPETQALDDLPEGYVRARITKAGHGKVSKGTIDMSEASQERTKEGALSRIQPFPFHEKGDTVALPKPIADGLEDRGFVEVQD